MADRSDNVLPTGSHLPGRQPRKKQEFKGVKPDHIDEAAFRGQQAGEAPSPEKTSEVDDLVRQVLRRLIRLIGYRSLRSGSLCVTQGRDTDALWRWTRRPGLVNPHGRSWAAMIWHLHMRRDHGMIFTNVRGFDTATRTLILTARARGAHVEDCDIVKVLEGSRHYFHLWRWLGGSCHTFGYEAGELAYLVRAKPDGPPADLYRPTRLEWLHLAEMAIWHVYGYDLTALYSVDWAMRVVTWKLGREPRSRWNGMRPLPSQLPVDPCDLLDGPEHPL